MSSANGSRGARRVVIVDVKSLAALAPYSVAVNVGYTAEQNGLDQSMTYGSLLSQL
jgi:hypothetical protein